MIIVDGYNLLYNTEFSAKDRLVEQLEKYCRENDQQAKVIFDGHSYERLNTKRVEVIFGGDADEYIKKILDASFIHLLVTSDKELKFFARQKKVKTIDSEKFNFQTQNKKNNTKDKDADFFISDKEAKDLLKEFNHFKK